MQTRFLGRSGLEVSVLGFGAMTFGDGQGSFATMGGTHGEDARHQVDMCLDAGVTLFDTADVYSEGLSEEILGEALGTRRKYVVLATKAFGRMGRNAHDMGLSRRHLIEACEASLKRLGTDWIDLYQIHNWDGRVPIEETMRALDDLVTAGKVRYVGCSNYGGWHLMKALAAADKMHQARFIGQQIQYSLMAREAEDELLPCGIDQGVGALIWSPLAQGFLTGKFRKERSEPTRLEQGGGIRAYQTPRGEAVLAAMDTIVAARSGVTHGQVAINWLLRRTGVSSVLIGARGAAQLAENLAAQQWQLSDAEMELLDRASQTRPRYPYSHHRIYGGERNETPFPYYARR
ncbi:aldo/keto reductase [Novosphingobium sp. ERN07]|uniref:aldo/keto reductase n=1 Tax=Novosphingobium sp. ERN07 TaxID=2726187 RepID=UPI001456FD48|nr:aldo/keto reductase [Novosphingobium sp. ERN07]NLR72820.1 aldo/keto reductase [Novosphingobium sp. ERN07]